jgi:alpha-beta hydrolase superfamily lysophospholipase
MKRISVRLKLFFAVLFLAGARAEAGQEAVSLKTTDGCLIEAFYSAPSSGAYIFINTHGLGSDRHEWGPFEEILKAKGYGWLSLDLRGHGASRSCGGKEADYRKFSKAAWADVSRDIEAAAAWLKKKGFSPKRLIFCGASIGANLSVKAAAEGRVKPAALVLLSPGLDYAGVKPELYLARNPKKILIAAAEDDPYAWNSAQALHGAARKKDLSPASIDGGRGHGVNMLKARGVTQKILDWVSGL